MALLTLYATCDHTDRPEQGSPCWIHFLRHPCSFGRATSLPYFSPHVYGIPIEIKIRSNVFFGFKIMRLLGMCAFPWQKKNIYTWKKLFDGHQLHISSSSILNWIYLTYPLILDEQRGRSEVYVVLFLWRITITVRRKDVMIFGQFFPFLSPRDFSMAVSEMRKQTKKRGGKKKEIF